jgi:hypothetical protein
MPRLRPKHKFKADQLVVCWQTGGVDDTIVPDGVIFKGTRLRGNHPWVKAYPQFFVAADTADDELPSPFEGLGRGAPYEPATTILEQLPPEELVECTNSITVGLGGVLGFEKGRRYPKTKAAEFIERFPECFREVT